MRVPTGFARYVLALFLGGRLPLAARLVSDGGTRPLANVTNTMTGTVTVGTNDSFTLLTLSDNARLTNTVHGVIGRNATALSNEVKLLGGTAGTNVVLVTGPESLWNNRGQLAVGQASPGNQLIVGNGAQLVSVIGTVGNQPGGSNNLVVVTGAGSIWTNALEVNVGGSGRGNGLIVEAGGVVGGESGRLGAIFSGQGEALVTGAGSLWSSRTDLAVGLNVAGSVLVVSNIGPGALSAGNRFQLFLASSYSGTFTGLTFPPLPAGLTWTNKLLVDGSLEVASVGPPGFSSLSLNGTNLVLAGTNGPANSSYTVLTSTNVALPLSNWGVVLTNQFDRNGRFKFSQPVVPGIPQRFFLVASP